MSLLDYIDHGAETLVGSAVRRIREFAPKDRPYWLAFSGGKDSVVIKWLADLAGVKYDAYYNATTLDPPELVKFIKAEHPDVVFLKPKRKLKDAFIYHRFPPTRKIRWCCQDLKEGGGEGRTIMLGIRWAESGSRSRRRMVELCRQDITKRYVSPIIDWEDYQLWEIIRSNGIPYCSLYDEGFHRLGCVLCPMTTTSQRDKEAVRWPVLVDYWKRCFRAMYEAGPKSREDWGKFDTFEKFWDWWYYDEAEKPRDEDQQCFRLTDN